VTDRAASFHLAGVLIWRSYREQRAKLFLLPLAFAGLIALFTLVAFYVPGILTGTTRLALRRAAELYFPTIADSRAALALAMLFIQGPFFAALFASLTGAMTAQAAVGSEAARGGFELLLSAPYRPREIFVAMLAASLAITLTSWAVLMLAMMGIVALALSLVGSRPVLSTGFLVLAFLLPLPMALWANLIGLAFALMFPRLAQARIGTSTSLVQLVAILPGLILLLLATVRPDINLAAAAGIAIALALAGVAAGLTVLRRWFRPGALLES